MKRTNNYCQGVGIEKPSPVTFVHISFEIMRMAAISVFLPSMLLFIWPSGLSYASSLEKVQPANPVTLPSTSLKTIIVGNYQPYTFVNDQGIPDGFSVDVAKAVTHVMDLSLEIRVDTWEHATEALQDGTIDLLPMMAASPERDKSFDFSAPHTIAYDAIFMRIGAPRSRSLKELTDKTVIVMNKDAAHQYLLSSGMAVKMKLILVDSLPDALRTLAAGKGDAALMPKLVGLVIMKKLNLTNLDPAPVVIEAYNRPFSFAVKDSNQALLERLSQGLSIIKSTGQYQEIYNKWFGSLEPPTLSRAVVIKYIAGIVAVFLIVALGLIFWTVLLRRQVSLRTKHLALEIQERKQAEAEIQQLNAELEQKVLERTTQLEATNKELMAFSYSVSHDLRAPLRSIDGFSQALLEDCGNNLDNMGKTYLERIRKASQRMGLLIDDMLKLSRITQAEIKRGAVDLSGIIREIAEANQKGNSARAVDVTVQGGIMVQGDPRLIRIAMVSLLENAFKFTGKEAHPRIEFGTTVRNGETACFIRDNGAGFEMAYAGKLFGAFQRLHAADDFPGTGIGLATVQRVVHRHGGQVWAEGEKGKGATFYFTLP
ncbi:MAG: sensor histidine kinase [Syntrophales bacterium]